MDFLTFNFFERENFFLFKSACSNSVAQSLCYSLFFFISLLLFVMFFSFFFLLLDSFQFQFLIWGGVVLFHFCFIFFYLYFMSYLLFHYHSLLFCFDLMLFFSLSQSVSQSSMRFQQYSFCYFIKLLFHVDEFFSIISLAEVR